MLSKELQEQKSKDTASLDMLDTMRKVFRFSMQVDYETALFDDPPSPERRLMTAILERALNDLHSRTPHISRGALHWFTGNDRRYQSKHWVGISFEQVKSVLEFTNRQLKLIEDEVKKVIYDKSMQKREESGKRPS